MHNGHQGREIHVADFDFCCQGGEQTQKCGEWMTAAYREDGYLLTEIAAQAGLHYSSISKIIKAWEEGENSLFKS
ncbi:MAG: hypothetical protein CMF63_05060 [Magnetovibrio sp.]|nr:hypothetical protein [Magnetovibrio sp.]